MANLNEEFECVPKWDPNVVKPNNLPTNLDRGYWWVVMDPSEVGQACDCPAMIDYHLRLNLSVSESETGWDWLVSWVVP